MRRLKRMSASQNAALRVASSPWAVAGSGMLRWVVIGRPGSCGQTSRARSHTVITRSHRSLRTASTPWVSVLSS